MSHITSGKVKVRGKLNHGEVLPLQIRLKDSLVRGVVYEWVYINKVTNYDHFGYPEHYLHFYSSELGKDIHLTNDQYQKALNNIVGVSESKWFGGL